MIILYYTDNTMIATALYRLDVTDTQWQVSHLFEHMLIRGFFKLLNERDISSDLVGWVQADTFDDQIFIDTGFYNVSTQKIFNEYISRLPVFTDDDITYSIATIQAEDKLLITTSDTVKLGQEIEKLSHRAWNVDHVLSQKIVARPLLEQKVARKFRDIIIEVHANHLTKQEQKLLLRFRTILIDIAYEALATIPGIYQRGSSALALRGEDMAYMSHYTITRSTVNLKHIHKLLEQRFQAYYVSSAMPAIHDHFTQYVQEPLWQAMPVEYFRDTGIITTVEEIASYATRETIESLMDKISFIVRDYGEVDGQFIF